MIDLVLTHLTHPWGPPWTLATLGDPWLLQHSLHVAGLEGEAQGFLPQGGEKDKRQ